MKKAMEEAAATAAAKKELEEKYEKLENERMAIQAELERERQAAIDAEDLVFKLEGKQKELEEENNELIDRIEEEEENNFIVAENKRAVESELASVQEELAALGEKLKTVSLVFCCPVLNHLCAINKLSLQLLLCFKLS